MAEFTQPGLGQRPQYRGDDSGPPSERRPYSHAANGHYPRRMKTPSFDARTLAEALGWFSVALGTSALVAPRGLGTLSGAGRDNPGLTRGVGIRELATGIGILAQRNPTPWLWARVAGDIMDLAMLVTALRPNNPRRGRAAVSFAAVTGILAVDALAASQLTRHRRHPLISGVAAPTDLYFEASIATAKSPEECYRFWRNVENLPRFMDGVQSVQARDERRLHWVAEGPAQSTIEWDCEITEDRPGSALAWRTVDGAQIPNAGSVIFEGAPSGRGTIVRLSIHYSPSGGRLTTGLARLLRQDPQARVREDLRRFKQLLEAGEIATTQGQPTGRRSLFGRAARRWNLTSSN
jgi:uncharacterized membrane protein